MNQAIHNVDLLYWLMGDVESIAAHDRDPGPRADRGRGHRRRQPAVQERRPRRRSRPPRAPIPACSKRTEIHGDRGSARVEQDDITLWDFQEKVPSDNEVFAAMAGQTGFKAGASDPRGITHIGHRDQLADFLQAIDEGRAPLVDGREGRKSVEIIRAIYRVGRDRAGREAAASVCGVWAPRRIRRSSSTGACSARYQLVCRPTRRPPPGSAGL